MKSSKIPCLTEHQEQVNFFKWVEIELHKKYPELEYLLFAIPNGGHRHISVAKAMRAEGVKRGVPDIFLALPRNGYHGLFIEMKRIQKGRLTEKQHDFINFASKNGYLCTICYGCEAAQKALMDYMEGVNE